MSFLKQDLGSLLPFLVPLPNMATLNISLLLVSVSLTDIWGLVAEPRLQSPKSSDYRRRNATCNF